MGEVRTNELTAKQAAFVREYLVDLNATQAAIRAGYSAKTASSQGERLLRNVEVAKSINTAITKRAQKVEITAERVLAELAGIGFTELERTKNEDGELEYPLVRASDKTKALELLGKHLKLFTDKVEHQHAFEGLTDEQLETRYRALVSTLNVGPGEVEE